MIDLRQKQRGERLGKGLWFLNQDAEVKVTCPGCGGIGDLNDHKIADDGLVQPSLICDCGFHDFVVLRDWQTKTGD